MADSTIDTFLPDSCEGKMLKFGTLSEEEVSKICERRRLRHEPLPQNGSSLTNGTIQKDGNVTNVEVHGDRFWRFHPWNDEKKKNDLASYIKWKQTASIPVDDASQKFRHLMKQARDIEPCSHLDELHRRRQFRDDDYLSQKESFTIVEEKDMNGTVNSRTQHVPRIARPPRLGFVTMIRNSADHLIQWLEFHIMQGVEVFFIIDDYSTDNVYQLLDEAGYIDDGIVHFDTTQNLMFHKKFEDGHLATLQSKYHGKSKEVQEAYAKDSTSPEVTFLDGFRIGYAQELVFQWAGLQLKEMNPSMWIGAVDVDEYIAPNMTTYLLQELKLEEESDTPPNDKVTLHDRLPNLLDVFHISLQKERNIYYTEVYPITYGTSFLDAPPSVEEGELLMQKNYMHARFKHPFSTTKAFVVAQYMRVMRIHNHLQTATTSGKEGKSIYPGDEFLTFQHYQFQSRSDWLHRLYKRSRCRHTWSVLKETLLNECICHAADFFLPIMQEKFGAPLSVGASEFVRILRTPGMRWSDLMDTTWWKERVDRSTFKSTCPQKCISEENPIIATEYFSSTCVSDKAEMESQDTMDFPPIKVEKATGLAFLDYKEVEISLQPKVVN